MKQPEKAYQKPEPFVAAIVEPDRKFESDLIDQSWMNKGKRIIPLPPCRSDRRTFRIPEPLAGDRLRLFVAERYEAEREDAAIIVCGYLGMRFLPWFQDCADRMPDGLTAWFSPAEGYSIFTVRARASNPSFRLRNHWLKRVDSRSVRIEARIMTDDREEFVRKKFREQYGDAWNAAREKARNRETELGLTRSDPSIRTSYYRRQAPT